MSSVVRVVVRLSTSGKSSGVSMLSISRCCKQYYSFAFLHVVKYRALQVVDTKFPEKEVGFGKLSFLDVAYVTLTDISSAFTPSHSGLIASNCNEIEANTDFRFL